MLNNLNNTEGARKDLTIAELTQVLENTTDDKLKTKIYYLLGSYYHDGTNGATKDIVKAIECMQKSVELDKENAELHFSLGYYMLEKVSCEPENTNGLIDAVLRLVIAYRKGSKRAGLSRQHYQNHDGTDDFGTMSAI